MTPTDPTVVWTPEGPRSARFGDVYFSREDGLAETRAVFLDGCGLPQAWAGRRDFVVGELGFGTGLNIAALLELWRQERPEGGRLHLFSIEAFPLSREEAARAMAPWPELQTVTALLLERWPSRAPGFHRVDLPELGARLDLYVGDVGEALSSWSGRADAWFLDGFAPATNPEMWREEVMAAIAQRSAPGARVATFTVAGLVRRGLAAQGFEVAKRPGFGRKRERLEARLPGAPLDPPRPRSVAVIGAGIAGAALARALREVGLAPVVVEAAGPGAGGSGNAAALVTPRLDAGGGAVARLSIQAFERACALYRASAPEAVLARGVLQLEGQPRDAARFDKLAALPFWDEGALTRLDAAAAGDRLGEASPCGGLMIDEALVIEPEAVLRAWLDQTPVVRANIARLERTADGWMLLDAGGAAVLGAEAVVLAAGFGLQTLAPGLVSPVRGQATCAEGVPSPAPAAWGGYVIPTRTGLLFGATHDRGDASTGPRPGDDGRNLETLRRVRPGLAASLKDRPLTGRAAVRAATPDRLPLCGELQPGLHVLGGLGSRGFSFAPLLAEHLAASLAGLPSPLPRDLAALVAPDRVEPGREVSSES